MTNRELYINDLLVDLDENETIEFTFQLNDVADLTDRQASYSSEINLPFTKNNLKVLDWSNEIGTLSTMPYSNLKVRYVEDGVEIIKAGSAIVTKSDTGFTLTIYGGLYNFFSLLEDGLSSDGSYGLKLTDIDTSDIDHVWDMAHIANSINNKLDYVYGAINTGHIQTTNGGAQLDAYHQHPSVYVKYLIRKIFEKQKYKVQGKVFETAGNRLDRMVMPITSHIFNGNYLQAIAETMIEQIYINPGGLFGFNPSHDNLPASIYPDGTMKFEAFYAQGGVFTTFRYRCYARGTYSFKIQPKFQNFSTTTSGSITAHLQILKRHGNDTNVTDTLFNVDVPMGSSYNEVIDLKDIACERGDRIFVGVLSTADGFGFNWGFAMHKGATFTCYDAKTETGFGDWYQINNNLPSWSQSDFLKAIFQMLAISPDIKDDESVGLLNQFNDLRDNIPEAKDITAKIERAAPPTVEFHNTGYTQQNWFRYSSDGSNNVFAKSGMPDSSDTVNDSYGNPIIDNGNPRGLADSFFTINDATLKKVSESIKLPFAATLDEVAYSDVSLCRINLYNFEQVKDDRGITHPLPFDFNRTYHENTDDYVIYKGRLYKCKYNDTLGKEPDEEGIAVGNTGGGGYWDLVEDRTNNVQPRIIITELVPVAHGPFVYRYNNPASSGNFNKLYLTYFNKQGGALNLSWASLLNDEYTVLLQMLQRYKKVTTLCHLNQPDIDELNHFIPLYDSATSTYYYLNKIAPYAAGYKSTVELVKLF